MAPMAYLEIHELMALMISSLACCSLECSPLMIVGLSRSASVYVTMSVICCRNETGRGTSYVALKLMSLSAESTCDNLVYLATSVR